MTQEFLKKAASTTIMQDARRLWSEYLTHLTYAREYYGQHGCGNLEAWKEATTSDKRGRQPAVLRGALLRYASWCGSSTGVELSGQRKRCSTCRNVVETPETLLPKRRNALKMPETISQNILNAKPRSNQPVKVWKGSSPELIWRWGCCAMNYPS